MMSAGGAEKRACDLQDYITEVDIDRIMRFGYKHLFILVMLQTDGRQHIQ